MHDMVTCDCFWRLPDTSVRKAHFQMLKLYQPVRCRLIFFMLLRLIYYFTFQPRNESHFWEQDKTKCVGLPTLIVVITIMLIEKKEKKKTKLKKPDTSNCWKAVSQEYCWSPDVSVCLSFPVRCSQIYKHCSTWPTADLYVWKRVSLPAKENQHFRFCEHPICIAHKKPRIAENWKISGLLWTVAGQEWETNTKQGA